jgi:hypothetical protein
MVNGYAVRSTLLRRNPAPFLGVFLTWNGFGRQFAADSIIQMLREQFLIEPHKARDTSQHYHQFTEFNIASHCVP